MKTIITFLFLCCLFVGQSVAQWNWVNQYPHGNSNNRIAFGGDANTYTIVGNKGTIIRTTNNGLNWDHPYSGTEENLNDIVISGNLGIIVGWKGTILRSMDQGMTWTSIYSGSTTHLYGVTITNQNVIYAVGHNGLVLRSMNTGLTWDSLFINTNQTLYAVAFADANNGMIVGNSGVIRKTTDGGSSWTTQTSGTVQSLYDISYPTSTTAFACGWGGTVIRTTNGGTSWENMGFFSYIRYGVSFTSASHGVVVGDVNIIERTTDGGANWTSIIGTSNFLNTNFHCVRFYDANKGIAVGEWGAIFQTNDGGATWQIITKGILKWQGSSNMIYRNGLAAIQSLTLTKAVIIGSGDVFLTNNGGITWSNNRINDYPNMSGLHFVNESTGYLVATNSSLQGSAIFKSTNGGMNWTSVYSSSSIKLLAVHFAVPELGVAVGEGGKILRTANAGQSWEEITSPTTNHLYAVHLVTSSLGFASGRFGALIKTTDGGNSWQSQPGAGFELNSIVFTDANNGVIVGDSIAPVFQYRGLILRTTDGGTTWNKQTLPLTTYLNSVTRVSNTNILYAAGLSNVGVSSVPNRGAIFKSPDGGLTWEEQLIPILSSRNLTGIAAFNEDILLAVGGQGTVLATTNGGSPNRSVSNTLNNLNIPFNNNQAASSTMTFNQTPGDNPSHIQSGTTVVSVEVTIDEVLHSRTGDLTFRLEHNGVTSTIIFEAGGDGEDFISTVLTDKSNTLLANGTAPFTGYYKPSNTLSVFNGMDVNGDWTLTITDGYDGNDGILNSWSLRITLDSFVDVEEENESVPQSFTLYQNYPNPFNPSTSIRYQVSSISQVSLKVFDLLGREVVILVNEEKPAGTYEINFDASGLSSGVYFYQLYASDPLTGSTLTQTKKLLLLK